MDTEEKIEADRGLWMKWFRMYVQRLLQEIEGNDLSQNTEVLCTISGAYECRSIHQLYNRCTLLCSCTPDNINVIIYYFILSDKPRYKKRDWKS